MLRSSSQFYPAAKTAFLGFDDSAGKLTFIPDATISSEVVTSGTVGTIVANIEGNVTGTLQTAAQGNITSLGTLTGLTIANGGNIGSAGDTDAIAIASNGVVTFSQAPVFPDGSIAVADIDIDGATDHPMIIMKNLLLKISTIHRLKLIVMNM